MHNDTRESVTHEQAFAQLAWLANDTLAAESAAPVRAHLSHCAECRAEYAAQVRLFEAIREDGGAVLFPADASLQKLMARIDTEPSSVAVPPRAAGRLRRIAPERAIRWLAAAVVVEALGLGLALGALQMQSRFLPAYVTLSSPAPARIPGALVRVVFQPGVTLAEMQQLLQDMDARVVDGPTPAGVFTLGFTKPLSSDTQLEQRAAALRADPHVRFAEPFPGARGTTP